MGRCPKGKRICSGTRCEVLARSSDAAGRFAPRRGNPPRSGHASGALDAPEFVSPPGMEDRAMAKVRLVSSRPLGRAFLPLVDAVVAAARPADPLLCLRPAVIAAAARRFVDCFPGDVLYAVKCNPEPRVLRALWAGRCQAFRLRLARRSQSWCAGCSRPPRSISCTRSKPGRRSARPSAAMA